MNKDKRKTDFWIQNKSMKSKAAPGKYEVPIISGRKDHYHGPASFGSTKSRFGKEKFVPPGPGDYEVEPLKLVSNNLKNTYNSVFNSKVMLSENGFSRSASNSSLRKNGARTAQTSQLSNSILKEGINKYGKISRGVGGANTSLNTYNQFNSTNYDHISSKTQSELGSLILNSPVNSSKKKLMKIRTGIVNQTKTQPSIPFKKEEIKDVLSPSKYYPNYDFLHKKSPVAMITPHKISSPHNSGSLNKYIEVFIHDVVDTTSKGDKKPVTTKIIETMSKGQLDKSESKAQSELNNSIIHSMSTRLNHLRETSQRKNDRDGDMSFYIEANDHKSIALNTAPLDSNIKMRSPFVSKTKRYPDIKLSPGPGDYNLIKEEKDDDESYMKLPAPAFGSNYKDRTHFLN